MPRVADCRTVTELTRTAWPGALLSLAVLTAASLFAVLLAAGGARAEHEVYYRYVVLGFVKDASGHPLRGQLVEVVRDRTDFAYRDHTDDDGLFVIVARLGDENLGETLTLRVGDQRLRLTVSFDPANHADARGTRVDVEGERFVEQAASFRATLAHILETPAH